MAVLKARSKFLSIERSKTAGNMKSLNSASDMGMLLLLVCEQVWGCRDKARSQMVAYRALSGQNVSLIACLVMQRGTGDFK